MRLIRAPIWTCTIHVLRRNVFRIFSHFFHSFLFVLFTSSLASAFNIMIFPFAFHLFQRRHGTWTFPSASEIRISTRSHATPAANKVERANRKIHSINQGNWVKMLFRFWFDCVAVIVDIRIGSRFKWHKRNERERRSHRECKLFISFAIKCELLMARDSFRVCIALLTSFFFHFHFFSLICPFSSIR